MKKQNSLLFCIMLLLCSFALMAFRPLPSGEVPPIRAVEPRPTRTPRSGENIDQELAFALQREQNVLTRQQIALNNAHSAAAQTQALIDKAQANGQDVTALTSALAAYNSQLTSAQTAHDQAAALLASPAGFDSTGQVTDRQAARQTLSSARAALRQSHLTLHKANLDLRLALQTWRASH